MGMNALAFVVVNPTAVALAAILCIGGLVLVVLGWMDVLPRFGSETQSLSVSASARTWLIRIGACLGFAIGGQLFTGWPVFTLFAGVGGLFLPTLIGSKRARKAEIEKVDALATWIESVRDNIAGSAGLQQALRESGSNAPAPIRAEVRDMTLRLQHESVQDALRKLAADLANPASDLVVACLVLATTRSAGSLGTVLAQTAQTARDNASMMRQIEAGRASSVSQGRLTGYVALFVGAYMVVFKRDFVSAYDGFGGQIVLFCILSLAAATVIMLYKMSQPNTPERVFKPEEEVEEPAVPTGTPSGAAPQAPAAPGVPATPPVREGAA